MLHDRGIQAWSQRTSYSMWHGLSSNGSTAIPRTRCPFSSVRDACSLLASDEQCQRTWWAIELSVRAINLSRSAGPVHSRAISGQRFRLPFP
jgi:hypothetical protein